MNKLNKDGVNIKEGKLVRYKSFGTVNECNTGQIVFLNQNIPRGVSYYLEQFGAELRHKFMGVNTSPHTTLHYSQRENIQNLDRTGQSQQEENIINTIGF